MELFMDKHPMNIYELHLTKQVFVPENLMNRN